MAKLEFQRLNQLLLLHCTRDRGRPVCDKSLAALCIKLKKATVTARDLIERELIQDMVFQLILTEINDTMKNPSKPIETKIGPHFLRIINKFPELREQWDTMSASYDEALRIHEQWCLLFSTPPTLANPAIGLPADASHGQSNAPSSPAPVPISAPTAPVSTQTGGTPSLNPVPPPNPVTPHDTVFPLLHPGGGLASSTNATKVRSATVLNIPLQKDLETPAAPAGSRVQHMPPLLPLNLGNKSRAKFKRPSLIAPELEVPGFWCAGKGGDHLAYKSRPGGVLATTAGPKSDGPDKKESRPDWLNLCQNEDPYICWKIFGTKAGCPHASDEPKCKYYHHMQQSILDTVVAKRGVNKEYIAWMIANYKRNVPASHQKELVVPTVQSAFAPPGHSQYRHAAAGTQSGTASAAGTQPLFSDPEPYVAQPLRPATYTAPLLDIRDPRLWDASDWANAHQKPPPKRPVAPKQPVASKKPVAPKQSVAEPAARKLRNAAFSSASESDEE